MIHLAAPAVFLSAEFLFAVLLMHPVHETVCEVEWNSKTNRVEVALRLDVLDEQWMSRRLSDSDSDSDWRVKKLRSDFLFDPQTDESSKPDRKGRPIHWVGRKEDGGHVWWFFEVQCPDGKPPQTVWSRLLMDRNPDYRHQIVILGKREPKDGKPASIVLSRRSPKAALVW